MLVLLATHCPASPELRIIILSDDAVPFRETEMLGVGSSSAAGSQEESVVWFNKEHDKSLA